jgi:hypothetical protein
LNSDKLNIRMKQLEKGLKLNSMESLIMSTGEVKLVHRLNLIISLLTMLLDEVKSDD